MNRVFLGLVIGSSITLNGVLSLLLLGAIETDKKNTREIERLRKKLEDQNG